MSKYKKALKDILIESNRRSNIKAPEDKEIKELCEKYGYGAVMDSVARQYKKEHGISAFTVGPCIGVLESLLGE